MMGCHRGQAWFLCHLVKWRLQVAVLRVPPYAWRVRLGPGQAQQPHPFRTEPGSSLLRDVQGGLGPAPGRARSLHFQSGRWPRMLEWKHMLTDVQAFLAEYWNCAFLPNKVEIFCQKRKKERKILWPLVFTCYKLHWASLVAQW